MEEKTTTVAGQDERPDPDPANLLPENQWQAIFDALRYRYGRGWFLLSDSQRRNAYAHEVLLTLLGQHSDCTLQAREFVKHGLRVAGNHWYETDRKGVE